MIRLLILTSLCAVIGAISLPSNVVDYPHNLAWLFGLNKKAVAESTGDERSVCNTEECKLIAKVIKESMDDTVDPCDDFYEYACGNWANNNPIPEGEKSWSLLDMMLKNINDQVKELVKLDPKKDDILPIKLVKKWYKSCMDTDRIEEQGLEPLLSTLTQLGGWPLLMEEGEWDEHMYRWQKVDDNYARLRGVNTLHEVDVGQLYWSDKTRHILIRPPRLPPKSYKLMVSDKSDNSTEDMDEKEEPEETSQEQGSEEKKVVEKKKNVQDDEGNDENEDEEHVPSKVTRRKNNKSKSHKSKINRKHVPEKNAKKRVKRRTKMNHHNQKVHLPNKINRKPGHGTIVTENGLKTSKITKKTVDTQDSGEKQSTEEEDGDDDDQDENDKEEGDEKNRKEYAKYVFKVASALAEVRGTEIPEEKMMKDINKMIEFQAKLAQFEYADYSDFINMTLESFQETYDSYKPSTKNGKVNWAKKVRRIFTEAGVEIDNDVEVIVIAPDFMEALSHLLDETSTETIVNYIHWNFISRIIVATTNEMRDLYKDWSDEYPRDETREERCIREVEMGNIIGYDYVKKHFSDKIKSTAMDMIDDIQKEVEYQIKESTWMDDETKDFIMDKLVNMKKIVGYPEWYKNTTYVKRYFAGLTVSPSYYENRLSFLRYYKWKSLQRLYDESDEETPWDVDPLMVNAFFVPDENSITITAADFQSPFFALKRPWNLNFGLIGFVMAHEVNHGFDNQGHLYNKKGAIMEWLSAMAAAYNERADCFVDQFDKYSIVQNFTVEHYGNQTAGENIADTMGLQAVYRAYRRRERECGKEEDALPGLEKFSNDQLFFLSFANLWCENVDPEVTARMAKFDVHSPGPLRVIGSVSNSEDFARAYNCPVGSPMNPETKCSIWK